MYRLLGDRQGTRVGLEFKLQIQSISRLCTAPGTPARIEVQESGELGMKVEVGADDLAGEEDCDDDREKKDLKTLAKSTDVLENCESKPTERKLIDITIAYLQHTFNFKTTSCTLLDYDPGRRERWVRLSKRSVSRP